MYRFWLTAVGTTALALLSPSVAEAKGLVLITTGDTIADLGKVSVQGKGGPGLGLPNVGYKYSYFGIFWLDLWTYDGTYCLHSGNNYEPISAAQAAMLLGKPEASLSPPWGYRFPLGLLILGGVLVLVGLGAIFGRKSSPPAESPAA